MTTRTILKIAIPINILLMVINALAHDRVGFTVNVLALVACAIGASGLEPKKS